MPTADAPAPNDAASYKKGTPVQTTEKALAALTSEADPKGTTWSKLQFRADKVTKNSIVLKWSKAKGAAKYILYGSNCGKKNALAKVASIKKSKTSYTVKKVKKKALSKGKYYKFVLVAADKNGKVISTSTMVHAATSGGKYTNAKTFTTKAKKNKVTLKVKETFRLNAKQKNVSAKLKVNNHRKVKYESSNKKIAAVSSKGVITAKKAGKCDVYIYAQNGVFTKIAVTVKK